MNRETPSGCIAQSLLGTFGNVCSHNLHESLSGGLPLPQRRSGRDRAGDRGGNVGMRDDLVQNTKK